MTNLRTPAPRMADVLAEVAASHRISVRELLGRGRHKHVAWPRQEAMWRIRQTGRYSLPQIGAFLGGRDHTTILKGIRAHERRMDEAGR